MARSLKIAPEYIQQVKKALQRNSYRSQQALADDLGLSLSTVKNFISGKPVDYLNFVEISEKLGYEWQEIADKEPDNVETRNFASLQNPSPFITGIPITHTRYFFGREKELKRLFNLLKRHPLQNAAIIGKKRSGKTSLLHYLKNITTTPTENLRLNQKSDWLPHPENYKWIFVDFQDQRMVNREGLLSYILKSLKIKVPNPCNLDYFMDLVSENLHNPTVILLDEIGVVLQRCQELDDEFWECLRSLATNQTDGNLAFVLATHSSPIELAHDTGHTSPFFNIFTIITLGALTETEARELIASSPIPFPDEDIEWILMQSGRFPLLVQIFCMERLFSLENEEDNENWREEGLTQIKRFPHLLDTQNEG